ncbi:DNA-binding protein [Pseudomonas cavernicola]|uniref:DNA-binding protein n=1 Tax=Pseudomonas cavernicola TaxID=2320866 RepID=A0A418X8X0_9PSED|nr:DNA-binding protein [Pseudomonas cavernicola]RJG08927.1 DNA-binding protein [Pseudomonas cavernicola]
MARGGINKALVKQARQALLARGENPSLDALRIELGNTGSKTTIHRYLKELEAAEAGRLSTAMPLSDQLTSLVSQLAERLQDEANETVEQAHERWAQERTEHVERLRHAEARIQQLEQHAGTLEGQLKGERQAHQQAQQQLQQAQIENARLLQAKQDLDTRLADRDGQIRSLEEKHQHARDSLEHYRRTSKEQREQEQRRHEAQVQQLQMDTRQLQQTLIVKQDDITQLNRDNERLLTEARLLLKEQAAQQGRLERQTSELAVLKDQLAQSQTAKDTLQERLDALQAESAELQKTVSTQSQRAQGLQVSLAEATTALKLLRQATSPSGLEGTASDAAP